MRNIVFELTDNVLRFFYLVFRKFKVLSFLTKIFKKPIETEAEIFQNDKTLISQLQNKVEKVLCTKFWPSGISV